MSAGPGTGTGAGTRACAVVQSPIGPLLLAANAAGLSHLLFLDDRGALKRAPRGFDRETAGDGSPAAHAHLAQATQELSAYFAGTRTAFSVPTAPEGTAFQRAVWAALDRIPYGATMSYAALADTIGKPAAVRAVGAANGKNPVSIITPCHRVIGANRTLTGFGGGLAAKRFLLTHEGGRVRGDVLLSSGAQAAAPLVLHG